MNEMEARARELFERSVRELDEAAVKRLRLARRAALSAAASPVPVWRGWAGGFAFASVLALGLAWWWPRESLAPTAPVATPSVPVPAPASDEPVLAEAGEDADLYAWLGEAPVASDDPEQAL